MMDTVTIRIFYSDETIVPLGLIYTNGVPCEGTIDSDSLDCEIKLGRNIELLNGSLESFKCEGHYETKVSAGTVLLVHDVIRQLALDKIATNPKKYSIEN